MSYADILEDEGFRAWAGPCETCGELGEEDFDALCEDCKARLEAWEETIASDRMANG